MRSIRPLLLPAALILVCLANSGRLTTYRLFGPVWPESDVFFPLWIYQNNGSYLLLTYIAAATLSIVWLRLRFRHGLMVARRSWLMPVLALVFQVSSCWLCCGSYRYNLSHVQTLWLETGAYHLVEGIEQEFDIAFPEYVIFSCNTNGLMCHAYYFVGWSAEYLNAEIRMEFDQASGQIYLTGRDQLIYVDLETR